MKYIIKGFCFTLLLMAIAAATVMAVFSLGRVEPGEVLNSLMEQMKAQETTAPVETTVPQTTAPPETTEATVPTETTVPETTVPETEPTTVPTEPKVERWVMPSYFQEDYPNTRYSGGTIATSGCSIVSVAMVATYMTGHEYLPDELAEYFGGHMGSNIDRLTHASSELKLPWWEAENWHDVRKALEAGDVAIVLMNRKSNFTDDQHFIVLSGITGEGKVLVSDPTRKNYDNWNLKDGFANGFPEDYITIGFSGAWIYDTSAMPEKPFIYIREEYTGEKRYSFDLTDEEIDLLARMVWIEAQGEPKNGQQAVAEVVLNRLASDGFQNTLRSVIYADGQFNSTKHLNNAKPTQTQYEMVEQALRGPYVLPMNVYYFSAREPKTNNVWDTIGGHIFCYEGT